MFSVACTDRMIVIEMCHIYGGIVALFTVGIHRRSTLDTCGYLLYRDGALTHIVPKSR